MENYNNFNPNRYYTEKEKEGEEYLIGNIDAAIAELVREKPELRTAYNYYNGVMDPEEFAFLEANYGIGNPTAIEFIPLVRKHIDALVGEHLGNKLKPKVTCKDKRTLDHIDKLKSAHIAQVELSTLKKQFHANLEHLIESKQNPNLSPPIQEADDKQLTDAKDQAAKSFISEYQLSAQFVIEHLRQNKNVDLTEKRRQLMLDLLIGGECGYKVEIVHEGQAPVITILDTSNLFYRRNRNSPYLKKSPKIVYRKWMTRDQILNRWGHLFESTEDISKMFDSMNSAVNSETNHAMYVSAPDAIGLQAGVGIAVDGYSDQDREATYDLWPVYEVEWLTVNKIKEDGKTIFREDRYKGTRIGQDIYVEMGLDETAIRSHDNPYECNSSFNGVFYSYRNGKPYSLVLATKNIQDKYNILHFQRDNLIANSGVKGGYVDVANIPTFLGNDAPERLEKYIGYKKQGIAIINSAQEGASTNNTIYAGFDDSVSGQAIQAIQLAIQQTEDICSGITGVFRERLGNIEQKDAVSNVEVGIKTSAVITKQYFHVMDNVTTELLIDAVNACKVSYKKGMVGAIILGDHGQKVFTIDPKYFSFTDYDIHIGDSSEILREMQEIKAFTLELIKGGLADVDIVIDAMTTESLSDMRDKVQAGTAKRKSENNVTQQLQQQLMQLQDQLKQATEAAQGLQKENEQLKTADRNLAKQKVDQDYEVKKTAVDNTGEFNNKKIDLDRKRIELEKLQLYDGDAENDEIKNT